MSEAESTERIGRPATIDDILALSGRRLRTSRCSCAAESRG